MEPKFVKNGTKHKFYMHQGMVVNIEHENWVSPIDKLLNWARTPLENAVLHSGWHKPQYFSERKVMDGYLSNASAEDVRTEAKTMDVDTSNASAEDVRTEAKATGVNISNVKSDSKIEASTVNIKTKPSKNAKQTTEAACVESPAQNIKLRNVYTPRNKADVTDKSITPGIPKDFTKRHLKVLVKRIKLPNVEK